MSMQGSKGHVAAEFEIKRLQDACKLYRIEIERLRAALAEIREIYWDDEAAVEHDEDITDEMFKTAHRALIKKT